MHNFVQSSAGAGSKRLKCLLPFSDNMAIITFTSRKIAGLLWHKLLVVTQRVWSKTEDYEFRVGLAAAKISIKLRIALEISERDRES